MTCHFGTHRENFKYIVLKDLWVFLTIFWWVYTTDFIKPLLVMYTLLTGPTVLTGLMFSCWDIYLFVYWTNS